MLLDKSSRFVMPSTVSCKLHRIIYGGEVGFCRDCFFSRTKNAGVATVTARQVDKQCPQNIEPKACNTSYGVCNQMHDYYDG